MFTAFLDTSVLWPSLQRDFLLSLAVEGLYRPVWSAEILAELEYAETLKLTSRGVGVTEAERRAERLVEQMRRSFDDAEVQGWEGLEGTYGLPDADDEHVVAAAVVASAGVIVTANLRDFPQRKLPAGLSAIDPARFAARTVELNPLAALAALTNIALRSGRQGPVLEPETILDRLASRYGMREAVELLRDAAN